jgi:predicted ArsR family transcriptional regulator
MQASQTSLDFTPHSPYASNVGRRDSITSIEAARAIEPQAGRLRELVLREIAKHPEGATADEVADYLKIDRLSVRPRCTELLKAGYIDDAGKRRQNQSGKRAKVWRINATLFDQTRQG